MNNEIERLTLLDVDDALLQSLYSLLEQGVGVMSRDGASLAQFLGQDVGLDVEFLAHEVQSIFCNFRPVDSLETSHVHEGTVVALSAAMPGLVGAVMRKDGVLASLRETITDHGEDTVAADDALQVLVWFKAFNTLREHLARLLLRRGVLLPMQRAETLLRELPENFWKKSRGVVVRGRRFNPATHELRLPQTDALILLEARAPSTQPSDPS